MVSLRTLLFSLSVQAAVGFLSSQGKSHDIPKLTTVGASVVWDEVAPGETTIGRLAGVRKRLTNVFRKKAQPPVSVELDQAPVTVVVPEDPIVATTKTVDLPSKPVEFRTTPLRIPSQPRPRRQEMKLAAKYAEIDSLEERAFQILVDLGMVEIHN
ncbi:expressed unknown protein [Seminavis robusta]|uniref:RxLR effector candidate protein n=1 Tax=Seminavis robusta TaxID=568900 RepID=A0A9N8HDJ8_9STRA|nr:expressed unknown protein [Seminavis robusta]|eukprot:Sro347_g122920.1 n/a (156) ;mRNA; r:29594-30165